MAGNAVGVVMAKLDAIRIAPSLLVEIVAQDEANDLALLKSTSTKTNAAAKFRGGRGIRPGDDIVVLGLGMNTLLIGSGR